MKKAPKRRPKFCLRWVGNFGFRPHFVRDMYPNYFRENESSLSRTFFGTCCLKNVVKLLISTKDGDFWFSTKYGACYYVGIISLLSEFNHL